MKKEEFKYRNNKYFFESKDCLIIINEKIFDSETIEYAKSIFEKYCKEKDIIINYILNRGLREFFGLSNNYTDEYIKNNLGKPNICIDLKKDDAHPNWSFKFAGVIEFCESKIDEHIISIEFKDNLELVKSVQING